MAYTTGLLKQRIAILNRHDLPSDRFGHSGHEWREDGGAWASVDWAKGKQAMNAGAIDVYGLIMVRMRYNSHINERSRIRYQGRTYQVLGDTFHADRQENTIQLHAQQVVNEE